MDLRRLALFVTVTAFVAGACGAAEVVAPRVAVRDAARATAEQSRMRVTLSLTGDEDDIATLFADGEPVTEEDRKAAAVLRDSRVAFTTDAASEQFAVEVSLGGVDDAFAMRVVGRTLYARADVAGVMRLFDADRAELDRAVAEAGRYGMGFLGDVVAGRWIKADLAPLEQMAQEMGGAGAPFPTFGDEQVRRLFEAFATTWGDDVVVERLDGDHYRLTVPIRRVFEGLLPVLGQLGLPAGEMAPPADAIPDKDVSAEVWVSDGRISRAELDLTQFSEAQLGRVAVRVDLSSPDGGVQVPEDAVDVDLAKIFGQFLGLAMEGTQS